MGYHTAATPAPASTRSESCLLAGSMIRASTSCRNTSSPLVAGPKPGTSQAWPRASSKCPIRDEAISSGPPDDVPAGQAQVQLALPGCQPLPRCGLERF